MKRMAIIAALLIAVSAYGGNNTTFTGSGDVSVKSFDKVVVIAFDANGDGTPDRAFVVGLEQPLDKALDLRWPHVSVELSEKSLSIIDSANHRALVVDAKAPADFAVTRLTHAIGIAHHWDLKPDFKLESLAANW
ncbi:MAG TPA: hypothetical protein VJ901_17195 [Thermoanaerobaculia bacterium]|nr:hypothetical protein [Thermoanaerobaculia bacterium]